MTQSLKGRSVVVTGGSKGIGKGIARVFALSGAKVAIIARHLDQAEAAAAEIGHGAFGVAGDVTSLASIEAAFAAAAARNGGIDVLCANAGIFPQARLEDMTSQQWDEVVDTNLKGTFHAVKAAVPYLKKSDQGRIVLTSSITGPVTGFPGWSHYGATKRAIESMTIGLARELKDQGIAVNALKPVGGIETPGLLFGRPQSQRPGGQARPELPSPASYVEAAVLLALATPDTFTGQVYNDAQLIERLASPDLKAKFRQENPQNWVTAMTA